jgi:hypothetical protein
MQTITLSSKGKNGQLLDPKTSMRLRAFRLLSERFAQRERSGVIAEFVLFGVIFLTSTWPLLNLAQAFSLSR